MRNSIIATTFKGEFSGLALVPPAKIDAMLEHAVELLRSDDPSAAGPGALDQAAADAIIDGLARANEVER
jgi:hypothetical protein